MTAPDVEFILAVETSAALKVLGDRRGYIGLDELGGVGALAEVLKGGDYWVRGCLEQDPTRLQPIPYTLVLHGDPRDPLVFHYTRSKVSGDGRLRSRRSVGVGGHVDIQDDPEVQADRPGVDPVGAVARAMSRELGEELGVRDCLALPCGLIYDPADPVGEVHLGVVYAAVLASPAVSPPDPAVESPGWATCAELSRSLGDPDANWEQWSRLLIPRVPEVVSQFLAQFRS